MAAPTITLTGSALKLLSAANELGRRRATFSAEELAVAAWESDREAFGLKGFHEAHLNFNKVLVLLMGSKGLVARGYLKKEGQKLYSVTNRGRKAARQIAEEPHTGLTAGEERQLLRFLKSEALEKVVSGLVSDLNFTECLTFWGVSEACSSEEIRVKIAGQEDLVHALEALLDEQEITLSNGWVIRRNDVDQVRRTAKTIQVRFQRHLNMLLKGNKP
jgi:hypothetical protein